MDRSMGPPPAYSDKTCQPAPTSEQNRGSIQPPAAYPSGLTYGYTQSVKLGQSVGAGHNAPSEQQQQQQLLAVHPSCQTEDVQMSEEQELYTRVTRHIVLACVVSWLCCWPLGLYALTLAMRADRKQYTDREGARRLGEASVRASIAGVVCGVITTVAFLSLHFWQKLYYHNS